MNNKTDDVNKLIEEAFSTDIILPSDFPNIDLYIDQILKIFEDKLGSTRRFEGDKILTKSMVNNYSKEKMITAVKGKKYNREQVLQILMIYHLKGMLAMQDIKQVTGSLVEAEDGEQKSEEIFEIFQKNGDYIKNLSKVLENQLVELYGDNMSIEALIAFIMNIACVNNCLKTTAESIVDKYFSHID